MRVSDAASKCMHPNARAHTTKGVTARMIKPRRSSFNCGASLLIGSWAPHLAVSACDDDRCRAVEPGSLSPWSGLEMLREEHEKRSVSTSAKRQACGHDPAGIGHRKRRAFALELAHGSKPSGALLAGLVSRWACFICTLTFQHPLPPLRVSPGSAQRPRILLRQPFLRNKRVHYKSSPGRPCLVDKSAVMHGRRLTLSPYLSPLPHSVTIEHCIMHLHTQTRGSQPESDNQAPTEGAPSSAR